MIKRIMAVVAVCAVIPLAATVMAGVASASTITKPHKICKTHHKPKPKPHHHKSGNPHGVSPDIFYHG